MIKRLLWFTGGLVAGALGMGAAKKKVKTVAGELAPVQVVKRAGDSARERGQWVSDAVREGRMAMRTKERELRARLDGRVTSLADEIDDVDTVLVDGRPVEPGQVIVLKQVKSDANRQRKRA
jgi:hypothetical protein